MSERYNRTRACTARPMLATLCAAALALAAMHVVAQTPAVPTAATPAPVNSALDERLLYQLLVGEMALTEGDAGSAYELVLDAARRTRDDTLFRRAFDIALQARAGEQALAATKAWRTTNPKSMDALRLQLQVLLLLNRPAAVGEPLKQLLAQTPAADQRDLILALPRLLQKASDPKGVAAIIEEALKPYSSGSNGVAARVAQGRAWLEAREPDRALTLAREASAMDPAATAPAVLALELMRDRAAAEQLVLDYLKQPKAEPALRMGYARLLTTSQRYADALAQLQIQTRQQPDLAAPFLTLGALHLELSQAQPGEAALLRYIALVEQQAAAAPTAAAAEVVGNTVSGSDDDEDNARPEQGVVQAWLMLAQSAESRGDYAQAERWLAKVDDPQRALEVQSRRASILARQGQLAQGRELIRRVPEKRADDARAKYVAEAGLLRGARQWREAYDVLATAAERFPADPDLLYEQAMMAEKIDRVDDMERLLRTVIEIKPDNAHAHNALGYSLADRRQRLPEARKLVERALELAPGDPFITDSLGWVEYRMGNHQEAIRLLRTAYSARPDTEIAAHLGEVLWSAGQRDEARQVWKEGRVRDAANDVLRETLARLHVDL